jgi:hypothetical protein
VGVFLNIYKRGCKLFETPPWEGCKQKNYNPLGGIQHYYSF